MDEAVLYDSRNMGDHASQCALILSETLALCKSLAYLLTSH